MPGRPRTRSCGSRAADEALLELLRPLAEGRFAAIAQQALEGDRRGRRCRSSGVAFPYTLVPLLVPNEARARKACHCPPRRASCLSSSSMKVRRRPCPPLGVAALLLLASVLATGPGLAAVDAPPTDALAAA